MLLDWPRLCVTWGDADSCGVLLTAVRERMVLREWGVCVHSVQRGQVPDACIWRDGGSVMHEREWAITLLIC